jgi:carbamoylphosphate synthase large subunit
MALKQVSIAISCIGGALSTAVVRQLRKSELFDYRIVGVDAGALPAAAPLLDAFVQVPMGDTEGYLDTLIKSLTAQRVDVFLPWSDEEAVVCACAHDRLDAAGIEVIAGSARSLELITNKVAVYERLQAAGLRVPDYTLADSAEAVWDAMVGYGYPEATVIVKPPTGRGGRGLVAFAGHDSPPDWLGAGQRERRVGQAVVDISGVASMISSAVMVMPSLTTPAYDVDVLARPGVEPALVVRKRGNPTGIPFEGNVLVANPDVQAYCRDITNVLELDSLHDMDLLTGPEGVCLLEVNPRPSGSLAASLVSGFPLLDGAVGALIGQYVEIPAVTHDVNVRPYVDLVHSSK